MKVSSISLIVTCALVGLPFMLMGVILNFLIAPMYRGLAMGWLFSDEIIKEGFRSLYRKGRSNG